ncbi:hypothetical protein NE237_009926 [Protea cynaroides]|uniref:Transcription factor CBF/NF-Y/archaeal histone domain-containing protein n=1 Tax=Protea cynaroides TaxID=273540 RepID=A0A9Q0KZK1_9MAGN|nr:hypothetical protein NE237_009926 [Protea cynaroides]
MDRKGRFNMMGVNVDQNVGKRRIQKTLARRFVSEPRTISEPRDKEATHVHEVQMVHVSEPRVVEAVETVEESCENQSSIDDAEWTDSGEEDWEDTSTEEDSEEANVKEGKATSNDEEEIHWSSDEFEGLESNDEREVEREKGFMLEKGKVYGNIHMFRAALADYAVHKDKAMSEYLKREYQVKPHDMQLYRAKRLAREKNEGDHAKSYALLPRKQKAPVSTSQMATRSQNTNASTVETMQEKKTRKMKEYLAKRRARMAGAAGVGGDAIGASSTSVIGGDAGAAGAGGDGGDGGAGTDFFEHLRFRREKAAMAKAAAKVEELPRAIVRRVVKNKISLLSQEADVNVNKDALLAFSESARIFIHYLSATANDICLDSKRQTINADDVLKAIEEIEFPEFIRPLETSLDAFRIKNAAKKAGAAKTKDVNKKRKMENKPPEQNGDKEAFASCSRLKVVIIVISSLVLKLSDLHLIPSPEGAKA